MIFFRTLIALFITLNALTTQAAEVAFIMSYTPSGKPIIYEGQFSHVAIKVQDRWLHAHPYHKIHLADDIEFFGPETIVLENPDYPEPSEDYVKEQLKKSFNIFARWNHPNQTYCSKLVGQYFNVPPTRMFYSAEEWRGTLARQHVGQYGLSPNDIFDHLKNKLNFKVKTKQKSCPSYLEAL